MQRARRKQRATDISPEEKKRLNELNDIDDKAASKFFSFFLLMINID